ncbi:hypothetical protein HRI_002040900 [Hibiscus trionum]|uniref:RNase H type-1 domain-containing protein n=1 Tax=Hibiscus trionum TaxID=183268 RepID=A0A9W7HUP9_HIBTR|nr:hypothetical protein HRI_002040900 [Hibiscus trionum]
MGSDKVVDLQGSYLDGAIQPVSCGEFMIPREPKWDKAKVRSVFFGVDADLILQCPISPVQEDVIQWDHHSSGSYSTRSAYDWIQRSRNVERDISPLWKTLQKMNIRPKIKIFIWMLCFNALPIGEKMATALIGHGLCPHCGIAGESLMHACRDCPAVKEIFYYCDLSRKLYASNVLDCRQWLELCLRHLDPDLFMFICVLLWNMWNRRNTLVHKGILIPVRATVEYVQMLISDCQSSWELPGVGTSCNRSERWCWPSEGVFKVNVDGAFFADSGKASIGVVARDHFGLMIDGQASILHGTFTAELTEVMALLEGLKMAALNGWSQVQFECDSIGVLNRLVSQDEDRSIAGLFLTEAKQLLHNNPGFRILHVNRKANRVAHTLAHWILDCNEPFYFAFDVPSCIESDVLDDAIFGS